MNVPVAQRLWSGLAELIVAFAMHRSTATRVMLFMNPSGYAQLESRAHDQAVDHRLDLSSYGYPFSDRVRS
jgi:hypothetical protein